MITIDNEYFVRNMTMKLFYKANNISLKRIGEAVGLTSAGVSAAIKTVSRPSFNNLPLNHKLKIVTLYIYLEFTTSGFRMVK